jgi:hypothetical protein
MRRDWLAGLALLALGWAATLWLWPWSDERINDLPVYRDLVLGLAQGGLPYREVFFEYPPLAAPAIALPGLAGTDAGTFRAAFAGWTLLLAAATVMLCAALAGRTGGSARRALLAAALMPILCGALVRTHFDLAPVALLLGALALVGTGRPRLGMAVLGAAVMTKGFPLVAAPPALAWIAARSGPRQALASAGALAGVVALLAVAVLAVSPGGALDALDYQLVRPVQVESLAASILAPFDPEPVQSHRSDGLSHPAADAVAAALTAVLVALLVLITRWAGRAGDRRGLVLASLTAVLALVALGRVLSPQYMLWILPLGALALAWRRHALAGAIGAAAVLTQLEFPSRYVDLLQQEPFPLALVAARNIALVGALALGLAELRRHEQLLNAHGPGTLPLHEHGVELGLLGRGLEADLR